MWKIDIILIYIDVGELSRLSKPTQRMVRMGDEDIGKAFQVYQISMAKEAKRMENKSTFKEEHGIGKACWFMWLACRLLSTLRLLWQLTSMPCWNSALSRYPGTWLKSDPMLPTWRISCKWFITTLAVPSPLSIVNGWERTKEMSWPTSRIRQR